MEYVDSTTLSNIACKIDNLQSQLYGLVYKMVLPDKLMYLLPQSKHKLTRIKGYTLLNPNGEEVEISFKLFPDKSVQIESNISLFNSTLILF